MGNPEIISSKIRSYTHLEYDKDEFRDVEKIIKAAKYHPIGDRGFSPYIRGGDFGKMKDEKSTDVINQESIVGIIIEDIKGLRNVESIVDNEFVDLVYVGTYDIAQTLGKSTNHKDVFKILEKNTKIIRDSKKSVGCLFHNKNELTYTFGFLYHNAVGHGGSKGIRNSDST